MTTAFKCDMCGKLYDTIPENPYHRIYFHDLDLVIQLTHIPRHLVQASGYIGVEQLYGNKEVKASVCVQCNGIIHDIVKTMQKLLREYLMLGNRKGFTVFYKRLQQYL